MEPVTVEHAFPRLDEKEMNLLRAIGERVRFDDGQVVIQPGDTDVPFYAVESGALDIVDAGTAGGPARVIASHGPGEFAGDIDLLTGRAVIAGAVARASRGEQAVLIRIAAGDLRRLLSTVVHLGEKLLLAFQVRRELMEQAGIAAVRVIGPADAPETTQLREFLYRNFVPGAWVDTATDEGRRAAAEIRTTESDLPAVLCADGRVLRRPSLREVAECAGMRIDCPEQVVDLAIVGAGPSGMAAAVYAASEGLSTVVLDRLGPGGQAAGSSMIENFLGFPGGLSGAELAERGVLQMLKFGAVLMVPAEAARLETGEEHHTVHAADGQRIRAKIVLAATGVNWRRLDAAGARNFERCGVYYAATSVESRLCVGKDVVVVGGANSGAQAAVFMADCARLVHLVVREPEFGGKMSAYLSDRIGAHPRIRVWTSSRVTAVEGDDHIEAVRIAPAGDDQPRSEERIPCSAVFVFIGGEPRTSWLPAEAARDDDGHLLVGPAAAHAAGDWTPDREPCTLETSIPRVLASGDVRSGSTKRVAFAAGDGGMAVTCVHRLLREM